MSNMSDHQTIHGIGRLHRGHRNLGCVGFLMEITRTGEVGKLRFDPVPDGAQGDVFSLHLPDGRIIECQADENCRSFQPIGDGPHPERRVNRRPLVASRLLV
jgi:hypothetical protein